MTETKLFQLAAQQRPPAKATRLHAGNGAQMSATWSQKTGGSAACDRIQRPGGVPRRSRWRGATSVQTWRQTDPRRKAPESKTRPERRPSACIRRRRECGSSPPLSALAGFTGEARKAGDSPNRNVTPSVSSHAESRRLASPPEEPAAPDYPAD